MAAARNSGRDGGSGKTIRPAIPGQGISISLTLVLTLGSLVLLTVLSVLGIGLWSGTQNTFSLLADKAEISVRAASARIRSYLDPAREQLDYVSRNIVSGRFDRHSRKEIADLLTGALAATPQVNALAYVRADRVTTAVDRDTGAVFDHPAIGSVALDQALREARAATGPNWGRLVRPPIVGKTLINLRYPVRDEKGKFLGFLAAAVPISGLSEFVAGDESVFGSNTFILYGRDHVLAHRQLEKDYPDLDDDIPLPRLRGYSDVILASMWARGSHDLSFLKPASGLKGHEVEVGNIPYLFFYTTLEGYGPEPWIVGGYVERSTVGAEVRRLFAAAAAGLVVLVISILAALIIGRQFARPVHRLAQGAISIRDLEFARFSVLPGSRVRELNDAAAAFNAMISGLRWFETYVPRTLVKRLMAQDGNQGSTVSEERELTVMFTDIEGFTTLSEGMPAQETADFLNHHFAQLTTCIENEGGTVDKFMGDGLLAFWGAPEDQPDHAERACRAARAIAQTIDADNRQRQVEGIWPVRVRIGLHSGPMVVGNIGAPGRLNYTIVGDNVNIGQRLESLGKEMLEPTLDTRILLSGQTAAALGPDIKVQQMGARRLRGRGDETEIYRLD